jgi:digeranylgeranylglycerophospholipid reductase
LINKTYDVIVIGAGPVGSYAAFLLSRQGIKVGLFEKNVSVGREVNCSGVISTECYRRFDLPESPVLKSVDSIKAFSPSGNYIHYRSESPLAYIVDRTLFDQQLYAKAVNSGATAYLNSRVKSVENSEGSFRIRVVERDKETEFRADAGIIATGFEFNNFLSGRKKQNDFLYGVQTEADFEDIEDVEVFFGENIAPGSFSWVIPCGNGCAKIGLLVKQNPVDCLKRFLGSPLISHRVKSWDGAMKCSPVPIKSIRKTYAERTLIVGEAAGQVKATTGGGIYFGLLCAEIGVRTILEAFRKRNFSEEMFKGYESKWKEMLSSELKAGLLLRNIFSRLSDRQIDRLLDLAKKDGLMPIIKKAGFDWHKDIISHLINHLMPRNIFKR